MNTRLRIDPTLGILEVEGSEDFVRHVYDDFKSRLLETRNVQTKPQTKHQGSEQKSEKTESLAKTKKKGKKSNNAPSLLKDLDLSGGKSKMGLREFYAQYRPASNLENNLIFLYYLANELEIENLSFDHVYTCYRDIPNLKAPNAVRQSLLDTSSRKGWIDTAVMEDLKVTIKGINYLEHDMARAEAE